MDKTFEMLCLENLTATAAIPQTPCHYPIITWNHRESLLSGCCVPAGDKTTVRKWKQPTPEIHNLPLSTKSDDGYSLRWLYRCCVCSLNVHTCPVISTSIFCFMNSQGYFWSLKAVDRESNPIFSLCSKSLSACLLPIFIPQCLCPIPPDT